MSDLQAWIRTRSPAPPMELGPWVDGADRGPPSVDDLTRVGLRALDQARARPGRVRDSAFRLLAADALITYACEAALEEEDPDPVLCRILQQAAASR